jgi:uncharacterized membrane protein YdjX (TVP38/TMEM64 family)
VTEEPGAAPSADGGTLPYWSVIAALIGFCLALFAAFATLELPLLIDPSARIGAGGWLAAAIGVGLLVGDVVLPVPASLVMLAHGALFGVPAGTALSAAGGVGATLVGFAIGRRGRGWVERTVRAGDRVRVERLMREWGDAAVIASRPIPILAETVAVVAGTTGMGWARVTLLGAAGVLPTAAVYALAGASAAVPGGGLTAFLLVCAAAGAFWIAGRVLRRRRRADVPPAAPREPEPIRADQNL